MRRRDLLLSLVLLGCAGAQRPAAAPRASVARDWMPLRTGAAWSYDVQTGIGGDSVLSTLAVVRTDGDTFLVRGGSRTETYEYRPDGVVREREYILKDPVREGTTWTGRDGATYTVGPREPTRTVGGQVFREVVSVRRETPSTRLTTTTWFAAGVGVVEITARTQSSLGTAMEIRSTIRGYSLGDPPPEE